MTTLLLPNNDNGSMNNTARDAEGDEEKFIELLVEKRSQLRVKRDFKAADEIRNELAFKHKIFFTDSDNNKWIKVDAKWQSNEKRKCLLWSHRKLAYCKRQTVNNNIDVANKFFCSICIKKHKLNGRIPCPLDPRHNCLLSKIPSHLRFCQSKPGNNHINSFHQKNKKEIQIYQTLKKNVNNLIRIALILDDVLKRKLYGANSDIGTLSKCNSNDDEMQACNYIHKLYQSLPEIPYEYLVDSNLEEKIKMHTIAKVKRKHKFQQASIAKHTMVLNSSNGKSINNNDANEKVTLIEYCSGKGGLSKMILDINNENNSKEYKNFSTVILIDRLNSRNDVLNSPSMIDATRNINTIRVNNDISNVNLNLYMRTKKSCAVGKHLCGAATDLSLKCYSNAMLSANNDSNNKNATSIDGTNQKQQPNDEIRISGSLAFAMCCHHLCTFDTFINRELLQKYGIERGEFLLLRRLATKCRCHPKKVETLSAHKAKAKAEVGVLAKRLFNECRRSWLSNKEGWKNVRLVKYISKDITPENTLLVGKYN
eukprot:g501.t1